VSNDRESKNQVFRKGTNSDIAQQNPGIKAMSVAERMKQEFGITVVPAETVRLPSEGKIYSAESGLMNREDIEIKAMTTREEDILTSRAFAKKGTTIAELIKACVTDKSIDVDQLVSGDRNALMVAIRITGYGSTLNPDMKCPDCGQVNQAEFDLTKLSLKPIGESPIAPGVNEFECKLPKTGAVTTFKLLTAKDEEDLISQHERKKKVLNSPIDTLLSDQLKMSLLSVNGKRERAALAFFVDNMPAEDAKALRDRMTAIKPDVNMKQVFDCQYCDYSEEVEIPIDREFFWPKARG
jgi:hypothetical protein